MFHHIDKGELEIMTNIGCGLYGPITMKQKPSEKHWPPDSKYLIHRAAKNVVKLIENKIALEVLISEGKFYGAEYYEDE